MIEADIIWGSFASVARQQNISMWQLSKEIGVSINGLAASKQSKYGKPRWPTIRTIMKLCDWADISLSEWAHLVETMQKEKDTK